MGVTEQGLAAIVKTRGNQDVHVILRGGTKGTNYDEESVKKVAQQMEKTRPGSWASIMIDCSRTSLPVFFPFYYYSLFYFVHRTHIRSPPSTTLSNRRKLAEEPLEPT